MNVVEVKHRPNAKKTFWFEVPDDLVKMIHADSLVLCDTRRGEQEGRVLNGILSGDGIEHLLVAQGAVLPLRQVVGVMNEVPVETIKVHEYMAHSRPAQDKLIARIKEYHKDGYFKTPVSVDKDGYLKDGYTAYLVAKMMNEKNVVSLIRTKVRADDANRAGTQDATETAKPADPNTMWAMRRMQKSYISPARLTQYKTEGALDKYIHPFDEIDITLDNDRTVTIVCGYSDCTKARFVFKDCYDAHVMNEESTNKTGYKGSAGRKHVLEDIYPHMPQEWKDIIVPRILTEIIDGHKIDYADPMWLPSATDVFGAAEDGSWPIETDSFWLDIFKRDRDRDRVKECGGNGTYPWWLRSVSSSSTYTFRCVYTDGSGGNYRANYSYGFAPGFDI